MSFFGPHIQDGNATNWPDMLKAQSLGWVKFVTGLERAPEAKALGWRVWYRHHYPEQPAPPIGASVESLIPVAMAELQRFVDGTFLRYAKYIDAVQGYNETFADGQTLADRFRWVNWHIAEMRAWKALRELHPEIRHMRFITSETAVGNDVPYPVIKEAASHEWAWIGYHPYWPVRDKSILPSAWEWYAGKWVKMEERAVSQGVPRHNIRWAFGETGPVGVLGSTPKAPYQLDALGGWRNGNVHNGDRQSLATDLKYIEGRMKSTQAWSEGRIMTASFFTTGGGNHWKTFEMTAEDWRVVSGYFKSETPPEYEQSQPVVTPPEPPPDTPSEPDGLPREPYKRVAWVIPRGVSDEAYLRICGHAREFGRTITGSYDDAGIGALDDKTAVLWEIPVEERTMFREWYAEHYPGTKVEFANLPKMGDEEDPSPPQFLDGVDISSFQGRLDDARASSLTGAGGDFIMLRAVSNSRRGVMIDDTFLNNWTTANEHWPLVGMYIVYSSFNDGKAALDKVLNLMDPAYDAESMLPIAIDFEVSSTVRLDPEDLEKMAAYITQVTGRAPIIYTSYNYWNQNTWTREVKLPPGTKLWLASWTSVKNPSAELALPRTISNTRQWEDWSIWQWSVAALDGRYYGVDTIGLDLNVMASEHFDYLF